MKSNHTTLRKISNSILVIFLSVIMSFFTMIMSITIANADGGIQQASETPQITEEPKDEGTPQVTEQPEASGVPQTTEELKSAEAPAGEPNVIPNEHQITKVNGAECVDGEVIVKFKDSVSDASAENTLYAMDSDVLKKLPADDIKLAEVPEGYTVKGFIDTLEKKPNVEYAQPNYAYSLDKTVNDTYASGQWHLSKINANKAWDITMGSPDIRVAVLDTGIDLDHPEFSGQIYAQADVVDNDGSADDDTGHGTHVAGIIAAKADNSTGVAGIAPGVKLIVVDVFGPSYAYTTDIVKGIDYAIDKGANVINVSFGCYQNDSALETEINKATTAGAVFVAAAGNDNTTSTCYPSDYDACISVIATTSSDAKASYSNYGPLKDISAPGSNILSTYLNGGYAYMSGTSMASPVVTGVVALMLSANHGLNVDDVKNILYSTANDLGPEGKDDTYGYGRVDACAAVTAAANYLKGSDESNSPAQTYKVTVNANCSNGTVKGEGTYEAGKSVTLSATPDYSNRFVRWMNGDTQLSSSDVYTFNVSGDCTITAYFAAIGTAAVSAVSTGNTSATVTWDTVDGASGYEVWRSTSADGTYSKIATVDSTQYPDCGLQAGTTYYYKVLAYCAASNTTTYGSLSGYATLNLPLEIPPTLSVAAVNYKSIRLSWPALPGVTGYQVYRAGSAEGAYSLVKTTTGTNFINTGLKTGKTYYYKARRYTKSGKTTTYGDFSDTVYATPTLSTVSNTSAAVNKPKAIKISWGKVAGCKGYEIWSSTVADGTYTQIKSTSAKYYTNTKLTSNITYYYKVRAYAVVSGKRVYGDFSPAVSATPPLADVKKVKRSGLAPHR